MKLNGIELSPLLECDQRADCFPECRRSFVIKHRSRREADEVDQDDGGHSGEQERKKPGMGMPLHVLSSPFRDLRPSAMGRLDAGHDPASTRAKPRPTELPA